MKVLPPGSILQNMYLKERLQKNNWHSFLEIGAGNGYLSNILLQSGMSGVGCDLNESACANNKILNEKYLKEAKYSVFNEDFLLLNQGKKYDLIISSMVIEHLPDNILVDFINKSKTQLTENGSFVCFVPASMKNWGIEDDIAGHIKRYEFADFKAFDTKFQLSVAHIAGLTYPLSNLLLKLSNYLIKKNESKVLNLSQKEKTIYTGNRDVAYKTTFPAFLGVFLNEIVMFPLHLIQKIFVKNPNSLVIYCELNAKKTN